MRRALASTAVALAIVGSLGAAPANAAMDDCSLGSPNILQDVTDCVNSLIGDCSLGSPNIIRDVMECLT